VKKHMGRLLLPLAVRLLIAGVLLVEFWPAVPRSKLQWAFLVGLGPPLYLLGE
jgi:hypothetical protein